MVERVPTLIAGLLLVLVKIGGCLEVAYDGLTSVTTTGYFREYNNPSSPILYYSKNKEFYGIDLKTMPPPSPVLLGDATIKGDFIFPFKGTSSSFAILVKHDSLNTLLTSCSLISGASPPLAAIGSFTISGVNIIKVSFSPTGKIFMIPYNQNGEDDRRRRRRRLLLQGDTNDLCYLSSIDPATGVITTPV